MPARPSMSPSTTPTPMSYDRFKPKFPIDPFATIEHTNPENINASNPRAPWTLDVDTLPASSLLQSERRVILIIGQPTSAVLDPLFASQHLTSSLLIIASHRPPALPFNSCPAVHTMRLRTPLAIADTGATRLIDVLEWALQVARLWRRNGGPKKQELMEEVSPGTESVKLAQSFGRLRYSVAPDQQSQFLQPPSIASPGASTTSLTPSTTKRTRRPSLFKRKSSTPVDPDTTSKPFDTILHFLPADALDKARLKAAILVTTLTRPYLASPPSRAPTTRFYSDVSSNAKPSASGSGKRWSLFRGLSTSAASSSTTLNVLSPSPSHQSPNSLGRSTTDLSDESTRTAVAAHSNSATLARLRKSRLIHVMPSAPSRSSSSSRFPSSSQQQQQQQQHVIRSIEAFLLSFAFSLPSARELPAPIAGYVGCDAESARARPYVLPAASLREVLQIENDRSEDERKDDYEGHEDGKEEKGEWTLAELVLSGVLESESEAPRPRYSHSNSGVSLAEGARRISDENRKGKERQVDNNNGNSSDKEDENGWMARRAWIGGVKDIVVVRSSKAKTKANANEVERREVEQLQDRVHLPVKEKERSRSPSQAQAQVQALAARNLNLNSASISPSSSPSPSKSNSETYAFIYPKKEQTRWEKTSNVKPPPPPAIEKRLPTPPQESVEEDVVSRSAPRSQKRQSVPLERRERESGLKSSERRLQPRTRDSVPPLQSPSTSRVFHQPGSRPHVTVSTTSSAHAHHHNSHHTSSHSPRHHHDYENQLRSEKSPRSPSRVHNVDDYQEQEQVSATSLPTPPDSEEASFENERTPTSRASPSRRYDRERRDRDWERGGDRYIEDVDEVEERNRRRRTRSHPSQLHRPSDFAERTPPRRAKTRPMEKPRDRTPIPAPARPEYSRSTSSDSEERQSRRVPVPILTETESGRVTPKPHTPSSQAYSAVSKPSYPMQMQVVSPARSMEKSDSKSERNEKWKFWKGIPTA